MADHLQHGATHAERINRAYTQQHEAHMAHRTTGDASFDVVLGKGIEGPPDDVDDAQNDQGWRQDLVYLGQHLHVEAQ